jgi:hypothetical protein
MRTQYLTAVLRLVFLGLPTWALEGAISTLLYIIGLLVIPFAAEYTAVAASPLWPGRNILAFRSRAIQAIWGNSEDGIDGLRGGSEDQAWWAAQTAGYSDAHRIFAWSALRNPVGNLRFISPFGFLIDPKRVAFVGNTLDPDADYASQPGTYWYFAWCGLYSGLWVIYRGWNARLGWKILPRDTQGVTDYRLKGCGTALQVQRK